MEESREKKKLYVFFYHFDAVDYVHSLYALDLPAPDDTTPTIPEVTTTITTTTVLGATSTVNTSTTVAKGEPERKSIEPILRFCTPNWAQGMTCARLDKKLYFLGGMTRFYSCSSSTYEMETEYPRDVSILDLSSSSFADYRDQPRTNMPMGPSMLQGKIEPVISFFADGELYVLSGCDTCMHTGKKFKQFEILRNNQWMYGDTPPFNDLVNLSYVIVNRKVIITGCSWDARGIWEYDLKFNRWTEFDKNFWTGVDENTRLQGSQMIDYTLWTLGEHIETGMPIFIPFKYKKEEKRRRRTGSKEVEKNEKDEEVKFFEVVPYKIKSPRLSDTLTCVGDRTLCYVQVGAPTPSGDPGGFNVKECYMSVTQFAVDGESAKHLNSAHHKMFPDGCYFNVEAAYFGVRKVDPDKWEFANEGFLRGQKHLLRNIRRRKTHTQNSQISPHGQEPSLDVGWFGLDGEVGRLKRVKQVLMTELAKLRQQQQNTKSYLEAMEERLSGTEMKQRQMLGFLAKAMQNPSFLQQLLQHERRKGIEDVIQRKRRRPIDQGTSSDPTVCEEGVVDVVGLDISDYGDFSGLGDLELEQLAGDIQG